ncbi:hypothetical protein LIER_08514 [Lithospermum erythrorhizon]|uniref:Transposase (putative) gypsy type domain-containing protein n=1 Tax=Lithospermum erythrorhizon TaxID=34254 RepID=A0AAV3PG68_LITER
MSANVSQELNVSSSVQLIESPVAEEAFSFRIRLPFSMFVNDLLKHINRAPGQVHPIGWLNITIFQVASSIARIQAIVPLFASLYTTKHRPYDTSLAANRGGRLSKNFLAGPRPNKDGSSRFNGKWFLIRGGIGPNESVQKAADPQGGGGGYEGPNTLPTEIISLDNELTASAQEACGARKEKSVLHSFVRSSKAMLPLLTKVGTRSKKTKEKGVASSKGPL